MIEDLCVVQWLRLPSSKSSRDGKRSAMVAGAGCGSLLCGYMDGLYEGDNWVLLRMGFDVIRGFVLVLKWCLQLSSWPRDA